jgi:uncharacterized protein (DUF1810 family)
VPKGQNAGVSDPCNLQRFVDAQDGIFPTALAELGAGQKQSHWMWFIFPQLAGLGHSPTAQFYGITSLEEGRAFLEHAVLGSNLRKTVEALLQWRHDRTAEQILGPVDAIKLRSSLTLFDQIEPNGVFARALEGFYSGRHDERTLALLNSAR